MYNLQGIIRKNINNASSMFERLGYVGNNFAAQMVIKQFDLNKHYQMKATLAER